ncbi:MAG: GAF domain-containing protein [Candidatus Omnitrophica bacterium]|nr:GAF domain-containing protein [Candidatus Omnitrophota bacterium]
MNNFLYASFIIALWLTAITTFLLGTFVFLKNRNNIVNRIFFFYSFCISWWSFSEIWGIASTHKLTALIWTRVEQVGVFFIPTLFVHFIFALLNIKGKKWVIRSTYFISIIFASLCVTPLMIADSVARTTIPYVMRFGTPGIIYHFAISYFVVMITYGLHKLYGVYKQSTGIEQNRIKYLFLGSIFGYFGGAANFLLVYGISVPFLTPFGTYALPVYVGIMAYAIVQHRLMDIRLFAIRFLVFILIYVPILSIPYIIGYFLKTSWVLPTMLETIFAPGGLYIYQKIQGRAEKRLLQKEYSWASEIRHLSVGLLKLDNVEVLGKVIVEGLEKITRAQNIALYVLSKDRGHYFASYFSGEPDNTEEVIVNDPLIKYLQDQAEPQMISELRNKTKQAAQVLTEKRAVVVIPAVEKETLMGFIFLGDKPENGEYSQIELEALGVLARQVAFAIEILQFIAEKEEMQRAVNEVQRMKEFRYLTSSIGHEVGNGIQSIADIVSMLFVNPVLQGRFNTDSELEGVIMGVYSDISDNIINLKMVTKSLRNYIREEDPGELVDIEIGDLINRVIVLLNVRNRGMKTMDISVTGQSVMSANPGALQAIFYNLLNNSYDAIIERENAGKNKESEYVGEVKIGITETDNFTEVRAKDNGIGMTENVQASIFTPLFTTKSHESTKDSRLRGGTGIGMETIRKMVEGHHGKIKIIWSEKGKGTEFILKFPKNRGEGNGQSFINRG